MNHSKFGLQKDQDTMDEADPSHYDGRTPNGLNYFRMPIFDHFAGQPYHRWKICQDWDIQRLRDELNSHVLRSDVCVHPDMPERSRLEIVRVLLRLDDDVFCYLQRFELMVYAPTLEVAKQKAEELSAKYRKNEPPRQEPPRFFLLKADLEGIQAYPVKITRPCVMNDADLKLHYGEDGFEFEQNLTAAIAAHSGGTTILRGQPGVGKTSFIRHLIAKLCRTHRFYYLPANAEQFLTAPNMMGFWLGENREWPDAKKIVILEDAEALLMQRAGDNREKVSVLLNVSDGLLGDFLQVHLIATINCEITKLDPAITRPGRLLAYREFARLSREQAQRIATAKGITLLPEQPDFSLAEIYRKTEAGCVAKEPSRQVGFSV
jgi:ATPase family associated with various cellular activities (AAA)